MNKIREDMLKVKRMVSEVEMILGKREGETELVNKLIDAENLLTYCMSRLENAIVPPCKVGDTVWYIEGGYYRKNNLKAKPITVTEISQKEVKGKLQWAIIANGTRYKFTSIGKTVFLTREEAEKALKERETE